MSIRAQLRLAFRAIMTFTSHFPRHCISPSAPDTLGGAGRGAADTSELPLNLHPGPRPVPTPTSTAHLPPAPRCR